MCVGIVFLEKILVKIKNIFTFSIFIMVAGCASQPSILRGMYPESPPQITSSNASPTVRQIEIYQEKVAIPHWKKEIILMKALHDGRYLSSPNSAMTELLRELDRGANEYTGAAPLIAAMGSRGKGELFTSATWLRGRILSQRADGRYSYAYAYDLVNMEDRNGDFLKEAAIFLYQARLALRIDGARCVDQGSIDRIISYFEADLRIRNVLIDVEKLSRAEKSEAMIEALSLEEAIGPRHPLAYLCTQGGASIVDALYQVSPLEVSKSQNSTSGKNLIGKAYAINKSEVIPAFISDEEWKVRRKEQLSILREAAVNGYH